MLLKKIVGHEYAMFHLKNDGIYNIDKIMKKKKQIKFWDKQIRSRIKQQCIELSVPEATNIWLLFKNGDIIIAEPGQKSCTTDASRTAAY